MQLEYLSTKTRMPMTVGWTWCGETITKQGDVKINSSLWCHGMSYVYTCHQAVLQKKNNPDSQTQDHQDCLTFLKYPKSTCLQGQLQWGGPQHSVLIVHPPQLFIVQWGHHWSGRCAKPWESVSKLTERFVLLHTERKQAKVVVHDGLFLALFEKLWARCRGRAARGHTSPTPPLSTGPMRRQREDRVIDSIHAPKKLSLHLCEI